MLIIIELEHEEICCEKILKFFIDRDYSNIDIENRRITIFENINYVTVLKPKNELLFDKNIKYATIYIRKNSKEIFNLDDVCLILTEGRDSDNELILKTYF
jgi:hypothetical protein